MLATSGAPGGLNPAAIQGPSVFEARLSITTTSASVVALRITAGPSTMASGNGRWGTDTKWTVEPSLAGQIGDPTVVEEASGHALRVALGDQGDPHHAPERGHSAANDDRVRRSAVPDGEAPPWRGAVGARRARTCLGCGDDDAAPVRRRRSDAAARRSAEHAPPAGDAGRRRQLPAVLAALGAVRRLLPAARQGYYAAEGLDVTLTPGGPNAPVDPPVIAGQALDGISAADYAGRSVAEGAPFKIIAVAMQKNPFVIASLTEPVVEPGRLVGKRSAWRPSTSPCWRRSARSTGSTPREVEVIPTSTTRRRWSTARSTACCAG